MNLRPKYLSLFLFLTVLLQALSFHISINVADNLPQTTALSSHSSPDSDGPVSIRAKTEISIEASSPVTFFKTFVDSENTLTIVHFLFLDLYPKRLSLEKNLRPPIASV